MDLLLLLAVLLLARAAASLVRAAVARRRQSQCYLLDYVCHKPCDERKVSTEMAGSLIFRNQRIGLPEYRFLLRVIVRSGIGEESYCPRNFLECREDAPTHQDALDEMDAFFDAAIADLFLKTGLAPGDVDVLVVNVCMFSPAPSLASRIVRRFGMREDVAAYNLSGMGCSAGLVSLDLARNALRTRPSSVALVVSTESIAPHWYTGTDRSMMLGNCLFRCGGSAALLTNDPTLGGRAKMALRHLVRANTAADDEAHASAMKRDDGSGRVGISLSKDLPKAAARALTLNLRRLAPLVLPMSELARFAARSLFEKLIQVQATRAGHRQPLHGEV
jgi:3-ketoacyl-CoA synthase